MSIRFGENLSFFRSKAKITQADLAEKIGVTTQTVWRWEHNEREPSIEIIKNIAKVLNCTETELLQETNLEQEWKIEIRISKGKEVKVPMDLTSTAPSAILDLGDSAMSITLKAGYDRWGDENEFEKIIQDLRKKRNAALKVYNEAW